MNPRFKPVIERIYARLLQESVSEDLAVYLLEGDGMTGAVLYNPEALVKSVKRGFTTPGDFIRTKAIVGYIGLKHHDSDCWSASEVVTIVGKGVGRTLYSIGFALSPSGMLVMDRDQVSDDAEASWTRLGVRTKKKRRLDDRPPNNSTPETIDDCELFPKERDNLNWVYSEQGNESSQLEALKAKNSETMKTVKSLGTDPSEVAGILQDAAGELFSSYFSE